MATKTKSQSSSSTTTTTSSRKRSVSISYILNILAYVAVCVGGLALFISMILSKFELSTSITGAMQTIANAIGWAVLCVLSAVYISHRRKLWMWIVWVVAVVMIVTGIIL
ncbi:MAG: hypothetical protein IKD36_00425 [Clostridia bacterium]|nr:hypothetical protein [Clostridia bacterium]